MLYNLFVYPNNYAHSSMVYFVKLPPLLILPTNFKVTLVQKQVIESEKKQNKKRLCIFYGMNCTCTRPGALFTKGLKSWVLSLALSHYLGQDLRLIH